MPIGALIAASAVFDRLRGMGTGVGGSFWAVANGWVIAAILGHPLDFWTPGIAVLFFIGSVWGWGAPMGAILDRHAMTDSEWWQVGPLNDNAWLAAAARGILWGLPLLPLAYWLPEAAAVIVAYPIAFSLSLFVARYLPKWRWEAAEALRGALGAALVWALVAGGVFTDPLLWQ